MYIIQSTRQEQCSNILAGLADMHKLGILHDVAFEAASRNGSIVRISAHRVVAAAASPVLRTLVTGGGGVIPSSPVGTDSILKGDELRCVIKVESISSDALELVLQYAYGLSPIECGSVEDLLELFQAAEFLQIPSLVSACDDAAQTSLRPSDACSALTFADFMHQESLRQKAMSLIWRKFTMAAASRDFLSLSPHLVLEIVSSDRLAIDESVIICAVDDFLMHQRPEYSSNIEKTSGPKLSTYPLSPPRKHSGSIGGSRGAASSASVTEHSGAGMSALSLSADHGISSTTTALTSESGNIDDELNSMERSIVAKLRISLIPIQHLRRLLKSVRCGLLRQVLLSRVVSLEKSSKSHHSLDADESNADETDVNTDQTEGLAAINLSGGDEHAPLAVDVMPCDEGTRQRPCWDAIHDDVVSTVSGEEKTIGAMCCAGYRLITGGYDNVVKVWDTNSWTIETLLRGHSKAIATVAYSESRRMLLSGSHDGTIRLWQGVSVDGNISEWEHTQTLVGHNDQVQVAIFCPNYIASGGNDCVIRIWAGVNSVWSCVRILEHGSDWVYALEFSELGLISGSVDGSVKVWSRSDDDWSCVSEASYTEAHDSEVMAIVSTLDFVFTSGGNGSIHMWAIDMMGGPVRSLVGHEKGVSMMVVCGDLLVSGSFDSMIRVWNIETGQCIRSLQMDAPVCMMLCWDDSLIVSIASGKIVVLGYQ